MKLDELRARLRDPEGRKAEPVEPSVDACTTCGHARTEHVAGYAGCFASACECRLFEWMP